MKETYVDGWERADKGPTYRVPEAAITADGEFARQSSDLARFERVVDRMRDTLRQAEIELQCARTSFDKKWFPK